MSEQQPKHDIKITELSDEDLTSIAGGEGGDESLLEIIAKAGNSGESVPFANLEEEGIGSVLQRWKFPFQF